MGWRLFDLQKAAGENPSLEGIWLRDHDNSPDAPRCEQNVPGGGTSPLYAFSNASAGAFWVDVVEAEVAREPAAVRMVFHDECDWSACSYNFKESARCGNISDAFRVRDLRAKYPALKASTDSLYTAGKWAILSFMNLLNASYEGLAPHATRPCLIPHDETFAALSNSSYARFYEFWVSTSNPDMDAAMIRNAQLEGESGVGLLARAQADTAAACPGQQGPVWAHNVSLSYALAAFMVAKTSAHSWFGMSTGWYDADWCWHNLYDTYARCGAPSAPAVRQSPYSWTRSFTHCQVAVDTKSATGSISEV